MQLRPLGKSPLHVPPVVFGAWAIGGWCWGGSDDHQAIDAIHASIDAGVNAFDTAPIYGFGRSEQVVGRAIAGRRDDVILLTKVGLRWDDDRGERFFETDGPDGRRLQVFRNLRPDSVLLEVERSLERLGTDYIDLVQCHWPDPSTPVEETMAALASLVQAGTVGAIGVSNFSPELLTRSQRALDEAGLALASNQPRYSLLDRGIEQAVLPWCRNHGVGTLAYSPLEQGLLTGTVTPDRTFPAGDKRATQPKFSPANRARVLEALAHARELAQAHGLSLAQLAIAWTICQPGITAAIVGARTPTQATENARAATATLSDREAGMLGRLMEEVDLG